MAPAQAPPALHKLPLHIVGDILCLLDTTEQLRRAVTSHALFHAAFRDNAHAITRELIKHTVPGNVLPYALVLLESKRTDPEDHGAVRDLLERLSRYILVPAEAAAALAKLSLADCAFVSQNYEAAEYLAEGLAKEAIPVFNRRMEQNHPPEINAVEKFRIVRALFRYQLMCNLFCLKEGNPLDGTERTLNFFNTFSVWVNEQLMCVYTYLERKVCQAFDELAAHDVQWGWLPMFWSRPREDIPRLQEFLTQGLPFLKKVACTKTYDEWHSLLQLDLFASMGFERYPYSQLLWMPPDEGLLETLELTHLQAPLSSFRPADLDQLTRALDGEDGISSHPFHVWFTAHRSIPVFSSVFSYVDKNLWECGYVLWDIGDTSETSIRDRCRKTRRKKPAYPRVEVPWTTVEIARTQRQRTDIYLSGGRGFWPREGHDFSRITGLSEEMQQTLIDKWETEHGQYVTQHSRHTFHTWDQ